ncbi:MAG: YggS family pyridoxal phosphate-dependent enzyme [Betaproteobacteria bacterium]|nr:MAG: YggS family pyridoxal phosphate-dependent enzyme [Betaproteobacteria bacterium]
MTASSEPSQARQRVLDRIALACGAAGRDAARVSLLAVSKLQTSDKIRALYAAGHRAFGENYVQEAVQKVDELGDLQDIEWHLIGPLQSNKTRDIASRMAWVHSIDRLKIAERLSQQRGDALPALNVCVQVNISGESSKSGVLPADALELCEAVAALPNIRLRGLMGMPEPGIGEFATGQQFAALRDLFSTLQARHPSVDTLSMGMSDDLDIAIACGSTMVRVGTALFGARPSR